jgi:predicted nucleotidyltransferase
MTDNSGLTDEQRALIQEILLTAQEHIERVAVFGSRAQGRHRPNSDLDLVMRYRNERPAENCQL